MEGAISRTPFDQGRWLRLITELIYAVKNTPSKQLWNWFLRIAPTAAAVSVRRVKNLLHTASGIGQLLSTKWREISEASRAGNIEAYLRKQTKATKGAAQRRFQTLESYINEYSVKITVNPKEEGPKLVLGILGFLLGSGGLDGDGGTPDWDLFGGIGDHRSILTHSILSAVAVETIAKSVADLINTVYRNLPEDHDSAWEHMQSQGNNILLALARGLCIGIAYHLSVDATLDASGSYHGLPISMPHEAHEAILATNAFAEINDAATRVSAISESSDSAAAKRYLTYAAAAEVAKRLPHHKVARSPDGNGFVVKR